MQLKRVVRKLKSFPWVLKGSASVSYSQYGEDIIMLKLLERCRVTDVTYLDIGANDPVMGSNTYSFYQRSHFGVLVEPNPFLYKRLRNVRPKDLILNIGISKSNENHADFYMFEEIHNPLNTFSLQDAKSCEAQGIPIKSIIKLQLKNINDVIQENFKSAPTIISLDVEGLDEQILKALDYSRYAPFLICVETVEFSKEGQMKKRTEILDFMKTQGYFIYADTHVNTIFCNEFLYQSYLAVA